ncbi:MAG: O-antigen ligase family protein [Acidobacteria bacterium]|nr:O-antigen ligase family protein [Acidobacteriota bacterium]MBI3421683.1 O-antigen ligase family protein [Acidobacteriota bacterium]
MKKLDSLLFINLLLTAVLAPLAYGTVEPWSLAVFELNALLLGVLLAARLTFEPSVAWPNWRLAAPLLALLLLAAIQLLPLRAATSANDVFQATQDWRTLSLDAQATRESAVKLLALLCYFGVALHLLRDAGRRRKLLITLSALGGSLALFAIVQKLTWNGKFYWLRPASPYVAPFGPYANYNHFAGLMELLWPLPFAYALFARVEAGQRTLWLFAVVLMAAALLFSLSRGGMLAFVVQLAALLWLARRWQRDERRRLLSAPAMIGLIVLLIAVMALWIGADRLLWRFQSLGQGAQEYSVVTRLEYWRAAGRMFLDHPIAGVGLGAFPAVYPRYGHSSAKLERLEQTHNDYLQLLTDAGALGGLLLLWFVVALLRQMRRQWLELVYLRSQERALWAGGCIALLGIAVHSFLDFNLQIAANALVCLLIVALVNVPTVNEALPQRHRGTE